MRATDEGEKKKLAEQIQARAFEVATHAPLGEYMQPMAATQEHQRLLRHQRQRLLEPEEELSRIHPVTNGDPGSPGSPIP